MSGVAIILLVCFLALVVAGTRLAVAIAISCVVVMLIQGVPLTLVAHQMVTAVLSYALMAIPGFVLLGALMSKAGFVDRLIDFSMALVGWIRGGLSLVTITAAMIFAGVTGSGTADTAAIGTISIPALKRDNYEASHAAALTAAGGTIGIIIPPSIPMIIYGVMTNTPVPALFLGGYLPGLLLGGSFMVYLYLVARKRGYGQVLRFSGVRLARAFCRSFWALLAPVVVIGGMVAGIMTPTEAAFVGVAYVMLFGLVIYRELPLAQLKPVFLEAAALNGVIMFLLVTSVLFGWVMARENIPDMAVKAMLSVTGANKTLVLLGLNLMVLLLGCLMDTIAILVIVVPVVMPMVLKLGIDPVHFGVMFTVNLAIGLLTPPVGYALYVSSAIAEESVARVTWRLLPLLAIAIAVLAIVTYVPAVTTLLPSIFLPGAR